MKAPLKFHSQILITELLNEVKKYRERFVYSIFNRLRTTLSIQYFTCIPFTSANLIYLHFSEIYYIITRVKNSLYLPMTSSADLSVQLIYQ